MTILIAVCGGIMLMSQSLFFRNVDEVTSKSVGNAICDVVTDTITYSTSLDISGKQNDLLENDSNYSLLYINDSGQLYLDDENLYGNEFYKGMRAEVIASVVDKDSAMHGLVDITVNIYDEQGNLKFSKSNTVRMINLNLSADRTLSIDSYSTEYINPYFHFTKLDSK